MTCVAALMAALIVSCHPQVVPAVPVPAETVLAAGWRQRVMRHYRWRAAMSAADVRRTARAVGFTKEQADVVVRIAFCESRHQPRAHTDNPSTGDNSYGLMMINMIGGLGAARRQQYGLHSNGQLLDPVKNLRVAWRISNEGRNWEPWSCARMIGVV